MSPDIVPYNKFILCKLIFFIKRFLMIINQFCSVLLLNFNETKVFQNKRENCGKSNLIICSNSAFFKIKETVSPDFKVFFGFKIIGVLF
jgi:hypothetical protein